MRVSFIVIPGIILLIIITLILSSCAVGGRNWLLGFGSREMEYYEDGQPKKEKMESKTPFEDIFNISGIKAN